MATPVDETQSTPSAQIRARWLETLLPLIGELGWTDLAARKAAEAAGLSRGEQSLAAPGGVMDLMDAFFDQAEADLRMALKARDLGDLRVHERVALGLRTWLDLLAPHRAAVARASARAFWPNRSPAAAQRCWSLADTIWTAIGDTSEDYNRYTKRGLLATVIPPVVLYWQGEPDEAALDGFIARRLKGAMTLGRTGGQILKPFLDRFTRRADPEAAQS